uniref:Uncharacterized protein n=1 Tax=Glossina austeni TaxID=7395 RepID=A0A1A9UPQ6_GLOAU
MTEVKEKVKMHKQTNKITIDGLNKLSTHMYIGGCFGVILVPLSTSLLWLIVCSTTNCFLVQEFQVDRFARSHHNTCQTFQLSSGFYHESFLLNPNPNFDSSMGFLARGTGFGRINEVNNNNVENTGGPVNNNKEAGGDTESPPVEVDHLQEEEFNDYLKILDNGFRTQIVNTERKEEDIKFIFGNNHINSDIKFSRCSYLAKGIERENQLKTQISYFN